MTARPITVTADDISKLFGEADPLLTFRVGGAGLVNGDLLSGLLVRDTGEAVGVYTIRQGTLGDPNYIIEFFPGIFTIDPVATSSTTPPELSTSVLENALQTFEALLGSGAADRDLDSPLMTGELNSAITTCQIALGQIALGQIALDGCASQLESKE